MKENLQTLLRSLREELRWLDGEKSDLVAQNHELNRSRRNAARICLQKLLPSTDLVCVKALMSQVPGFVVPTVPTWFGFSSKVDPDVSLDSLRMKLGAYLDNMEIGIPKEWKDEVLTIDQTIRNLQENLIRTNAERMAEIRGRIEALENLSRVDVAKMNPKVRTRLEQAVASQVKTTRHTSRPYSSGARYFATTQTAYPTRVEIDSSSGPSLLDMWLWSQVLTSHSECSNEVRRIESGGGGVYGGGGASGIWPERPEVAQSESPTFPSVQDVSTIAVLTSADNRDEEAQLAVHESLGSQSYS